MSLEDTRVEVEYYAIIDSADPPEEKDRRLRLMLQDPIKMEEINKALTQPLN